MSQRRDARVILRAAREKGDGPSIYRLFRHACDYSGHHKYLRYPMDAQWNVCADGRPVAACCLPHLGRAVMDAAGMYPEAVIEVRPWKLHREIPVQLQPDQTARASSSSSSRSRSATRSPSSRASRLATAGEAPW